jgi:hypothetical protein
MRVGSRKNVDRVVALLRLTFCRGDARARAGGLHDAATGSAILERDA